MEEDKIKEAFSKVKQDMDFLNYEIAQIKQDIYKIKQFLDDFSTSTLRQINPTHTMNPTDNPTHPQEIRGLKYPNIDISIGNEGASTDRQTDRQTDTPTHFLPENTQNQENKTIESDIQKATDILDSLDALKKQIRHKFKHVTPQEMLVFSTIYQLEEQNPSLVTYKEIALKLGLSESSIRDYVQRIINKGIPIKKHKINNKKLILSISQDLKRIATLSTIIKLREL
jgi:DNA-binding MarR family transcriptional regulator